MQPVALTPAAIAQPSPGEFVLTGHWTALGIGGLDQHLETLTAPAHATVVVVDGAGLAGLDTVGVWIAQKLLLRLGSKGHAVQVRGWSPRHARLLEMVAQHPGSRPPPTHRPPPLERIGRAATAAGRQSFELLSFVGESALGLAGGILHPARLRWRPVLYNIRSAGFDALPIVGLLSFLMGIVIAYQAADQLRQYGANIFVADLVGLSMLREFAPLMTAIIVAGRSGSAYAAQIGTMSVTEEIDAMKTIGIEPIGMLVLPKIVALVLVLPLLTFFADVLGVIGGMIMARAQLGVGFVEFLDRFTKAVTPMAYLIGIGKAPVFAAIIVMIGCFQGFRTSGGAESVGRQTTRSVVQSIFLVIVADALFSVLFSFLGI